MKILKTNKTKGMKISSRRVVFVIILLISNIIMAQESDLNKLQAYKFYELYKIEKSVNFNQEIFKLEFEKKCKEWYESILANEEQLEMILHESHSDRLDWDDFLNTMSFQYAKFKATYINQENIEPDNQQIDAPAYNPNNNTFYCDNAINFELGGAFPTNLDYKIGNQNVWCKPCPPEYNDNKIIKDPWNVLVPVNPNTVNSGITPPVLAGYFTIESAGNDPFVTSLNKVRTGNYSLRLGDRVDRNQVISAISRTFKVDQGNSDFSFWYAIVTHTENHEKADPGMGYRVYVDGKIVDGRFFISNLPNPFLNAHPISVSMTADITIPPNITSFSYLAWVRNLYYTDWNCQYLDLKKYMGETVTVEIYTKDCAFPNGGHFAYAYIDDISCDVLDCNDLGSIDINKCQEDLKNYCVDYVLPKKNGIIGQLRNPILKVWVANQTNPVIVSNPIISNNKYCFDISGILNIIAIESETDFIWNGLTWKTVSNKVNKEVPLWDIKNYEFIQNSCKLNVERIAPYIEDIECYNSLCVLNDIIENFDFINGFKNLNSSIGNFKLISIDSIFNFDCKDNRKQYSIVYKNDQLLACNDCVDEFKFNISIDCSCTPPECPPPTRVNPYLNNLAGNWQAQNSYAYNTKRVTDPDRPVKDGQYFENYNAILAHNGSYWSMQDKDHWISKETNANIDFNGKSIESTNPLQIPSAAKFSFKNTLTNHVVSNASSQETFFLSNEDEDMFIESKRILPWRNIFDVNEIELPLLPNKNRFWPQISNHWYKEIDLVEQSKDEFHTGINSLKVKPKSGSESYAYTQYFTCETQYQNNHGGINYCASSPAQTTYLDITRVRFGMSNPGTLFPIDNASACSSLNGTLGTASGTQGMYSDFSKIQPNPIHVNKGQNYNLELDFNLCSAPSYVPNAFCHVYFDWNQDGDFSDQGETFVVKGVINNSFNLVKVINIPHNALVGKTRMRIVYQGAWNYSANSFTIPTSDHPCGFKRLESHGETEDYTIQILDKYELEAPKETYTVTEKEVQLNSKSIVNEFSLQKDKEYLLSYWVKDNQTSEKIGYIDIVDNSEPKLTPNYPSRPLQIEGWHKVEKVFKVSTNKFKLVFFPTPNTTAATYYDDIRIQPLDASMKGYVYDERTQRLVSELDENNYATFYDYDEEGQLIRVRKETERGIMTIKESRKSLKQ
ncbi:MAG: GEVED domain-containing protein [Chitinophagales bacterium]